MEKLYVDLHIHTTYSDGSFTPEEVVRYAHKVGISAISITDHDIVDAIPLALIEGEKLGIEVIPGVELSCEINNSRTDEMHILGYFINWENVQFRKSLDLFRTKRKQRAYQILEKLRKFNIFLDEKQLFDVAGSGSIGRLHFAKVMIEEGFANSIGEVFNRFLAYGKPAYVPKMKIKPEEAIQMILSAGGIPVLAHPYYGHYSDKNLLKGLVNSGLQGIEVWHSRHPETAVKIFTDIANEMGLVATGGSDCHGMFEDQPEILGSVKVPYSAVVELRKLKEKIETKSQL